MRQATSRGFRPLVALAVTCVLPGCGRLAGEITKGAAPEAVEGAVKGLAEPDTQRRIVEAVDEARLQALTIRLAAGIADGLLEALEEPERRHRIEMLLADFAAKAARGAFDALLIRGLDENVQVRIRFALRASIREAVTEMLDTLGTRVGEPTEGTRTFFGTLFKDVARESTLGIQEALDATRREKDSGQLPRDEGTIVRAASEASAAGSAILWTLGIGLGAMTLGLAITLVWMIRRNRRRRVQLEQSDSAIQLLTEAIAATSQKPGAEEFRQALMVAIQGRGGSDRLGALLSEQGRRPPGPGKPE